MKLDPFARPPKVDGQLPRVVYLEAKAVLFLIASLLLLGCRNEEVVGEAPPAPSPSIPDLCEPVADAPLDGLPGKVGQFCLDPNADVRRYGEGTSSPLDAVCVELFNGECEIYKTYGLEGVKTTRYVSGDKPGTAIVVVVSRFRSTDGAFGFFTRRIVGDGLPSQVTVEALAVEGRAALGPGVLYLWRGKQVIEFSYVSERETPSEVEKNGAPILTDLANKASRLLVGLKSPPRDVRILEAINSSEFSVVVRSDGLFDLGGSGAFALTFFEEESKPFAYQLLAAERRDDSAAKDLLKLLVRSFPSAKLKNTQIYQLRWSGEGRAPQTWYLSQLDNLVLGVGPLQLAQPPETSTPESRKEEARQWSAFAKSKLASLKAQTQKMRD